MQRWTAVTPDGRHVEIARENDGWLVRCADQEPVRHELLDLALIEILRAKVDRAPDLDVGEWTRGLVDRIEHEANERWERRGVVPSRGDRVELDEKQLGVAVRGTVHYADDHQILVKWDDGRSSSLPVGVRRLRVVGRDEP